MDLLEYIDLLDVVVDKDWEEDDRDDRPSTKKICSKCRVQIRIWIGKKTALKSFELKRFMIYFKYLL
uniref:Uncharacterized protein n=1 Tax=Romanomermis culicivorax TaxID=13658 RepID=A0A915ITS4_ROMCU